jgi:hypothetical protein
VLQRPQQPLHNIQACLVQNGDLHIHAWHPLGQCSRREPLLTTWTYSAGMHKLVSNDIAHSHNGLQFDRFQAEAKARGKARQDKSLLQKNVHGFLAQSHNTQFLLCYLPTKTCKVQSFIYPTFCARGKARQRQDLVKER